MIDTIVLTLSTDMYTLTDPDKFKPSARWTVGRIGYETIGMQSIQNPSRQELLEGIYKPHLRLANRPSFRGKPELQLKIELSLSKLLFGNNFDELKGKDFQAVTQKLAEILATMGIETTAKTLAKAPVFVVHYSKNITLTDGSTPYHYINKIKAANVTLLLDTNQTDYTNDGTSFKWHCNSYEVVFYDKIKELENAKRGGKPFFESAGELQLNLFNRFSARKKLEILRMEVRLGRRQKTRALFKKLGIKSDLTFKSIFKPAISKKVLLHYIDEIESRRLPLLDYRSKTDVALLAALRFNNPELSPKQILNMFGLKKALEVTSLRELRNMFGDKGTRNWQRLMADANKLKLPVTQSPFDTIRECLKKFKPLNINMLNKIA